MHIYNNTKNFPYLMKNIHPDWRSSANHNPNKQTNKENDTKAYHSQISRNQ